MEQVKLSIGQNIVNIGEVKGLHFSDLFTMSYKFNEDEYYELDEIKKNMVKSKSAICETILDKLRISPDFVFRYLHKKMLSTQDLYLINRLNAEVDLIKSLINKDSFDWNIYEDRLNVKKILENFFFIYYLR